MNFNIKNIFFFSLGPLGNAALGIILVPIIASYYSPSDVGKYSLFTTIISLFLMTFSLGLDQYFVRQYHETNKKRKLFYYCLFPGLTLLALMLVVFSTISFQLDIVDEIMLIIAFSLSCFLSMTNKFIMLIYRMEDKSKLYSFFQLLPKFVMIIGVFLFIQGKLEPNFTYLTLVFLISQFLNFCLMLFCSLKQLILQSNDRFSDTINIKDMMRFGLPLIPSNVAFWALVGSDKLLIKELSSLNELGVYAVASSFAGAAAILQSIFSTVWAPIIYSSIAEKKDLNYLKKANKIILVGIITLFCFVTFISGLVDYFVPSYYSDVKYIFVTVMLYPLLYTLTEATSIGIGVSKKTTFGMYATIAAFIVNVVGNLLLIPCLGAKGAAISTAISFYAYFIIRTELSSIVWERYSGFDFYIFSGVAVMLAILNTLYGQQFSFIVNVAHIIFNIMVIYYYRDCLNPILLHVLSLVKIKLTKH
ncbi:lipopolysaccharide biosynthesis protein [Vibrio breoganii]